MIIESITLGLLALVSYMVKENTKAMREVAASINYCPTNRRNKKTIKGDL